MASSPADTRRERRARLAQEQGSPVARPRAPLGPTLALTVALAVGAFVVMLGLLLIPTSPKRLPPPFPPEEQRLESALYLLTFAVILPAALFTVPRLADRIASSQGPRALSVVSALLVAALAALILVLRALPGGGDVVEALALVGAWTVAALVFLQRAQSTRPWRVLPALDEHAFDAWLVSGALVFAVILAFTSLGSVSLLPVVLGAPLVAAIVALNARREQVLPRLRRRWGLLIDAALIALCLLAIPDLIIFGPGPTGPLTNHIVQWHQDFFLGPVNQVLHGSPLLVDTASQYGVGSLYFLAGWFQLAPIGYGTLGFLDASLFALFFAAGYCVLRIAGSSRLVAGGTLAAGIVVLIYNLVFSVGTLPQHGPLRFGLPMIVVLAAVAGTRWPQRSTVALGAEVLAVAVSSIWSLEAFAYTAVTFGAIACFRAWALPNGARLRWLIRTVTLTVGACVGAHLLFALATLAASGHLPDWGEYLAYLREFLFGQVGDLTYDYASWSAGLPVGAAYAASAAAFVVVVKRRPELIDRERTALIGICGITAYGIALYSYFVNRSADHILPYVSLPAVLAGALWLSLLLRGSLVKSRAARLGGLAFALSLCVLLVSVGWSSIGQRFPRTALAHVIPGGQSLGGALHSLWHPPPLDPRSPQGVRLVDRFMPAGQAVPIIVTPDLETEILLRSGRANGLGLGYPTEDSFVPSYNLPRVQKAIDQLHPGDLVLTQADALGVVKAYRAHPASDPLNSEGQPQVGPTNDLLPLQQWALKRIGQRFGIRVVHRDNQGFLVVKLTRRR